MLALYSFGATASDCSVSINSKESVKCLQKKISTLEKELEQSKKYRVVIPQGALISFKAKTCPNGWADYQANQNGIVNLSINKDIVKCLKL